MITLDDSARNLPVEYLRNKEELLRAFRQAAQIYFREHGMYSYPQDAVISRPYLINAN